MLYTLIMFFTLSTRKILIAGLFAIHVATAIAQPCFIAGCNSEICTDMPLEHYGICHWEPEFECYHQYGICERDANGQCAWVQTPELTECFTKVAQEIGGSNE